MASPPSTHEKEELLRRCWGELPESLRTEQQLAGRGGRACGATWGVMEKCNFACTSCYLTELGNRTEPLTFEKVRHQLDTLRRHLGPGAKAQITSGEVTLLPVDELGRIVRYALEIGLDPMVMTNGERFRRDPEYLVALVRDHGLRKIGLHIDTTQKGRRWHPAGLRGNTVRAMPMGLREADLNPLRDEFADLIEVVRRRTGHRLHVAHTVTVTSRTLADVADVVSWVLRRPGAFRLLSLQPIAEVGRTEDRGAEVTNLDAVWRQVVNGAGRELNRDAMHFGHRQCNITVPLLVVAAHGSPPEIFELVRRRHPWDRRVFTKALRALPAALDLDHGLMHNGLRALSVLLRRPLLGLELGAWLGVRLLGALPRLLRFALRGRMPRLHPVLIVVHKFMNPDELDTPIGRERLAGCVFRLALADGKLVAMCEMNATSLRWELNQRCCEVAPAIDGTAIQHDRIPVTDA